MGRNKIRGPYGQLWKSTKISEWRILGYAGHMALYLVVWLAMFVLNIVIFEVDASAIKA